MDFRPHCDIQLRLGHRLKAVLDHAHWNGRELTGVFPGEVPTPDANRHRTFLKLELWERDGRLSGEINAVAVRRLDYYSLPSWVVLTHVEGKH